MYKLLIATAAEEYVEGYLLRFLRKRFSEEILEVEVVTDLGTALSALDRQWDSVLVDQAMGSPHSIVKKEPKAKIKNGADLIGVIKEMQEAPTLIIGISSSTVANRALVAAGADTSFLKLNVHDLMDELGERVEKDHVG